MVTAGSETEQRIFSLSDFPRKGRPVPNDAYYATFPPRNRQNPGRGRTRVVPGEALLQRGGDAVEGGHDVFAAVERADAHVPFAALAEARARSADDTRLRE